MKAKQIVQINFLILGLVVVAMIMVRLRSKGLGDDFLSVMGLGSGNNLNQVTWCETRVTSIEVSGLKLAQEGLKWIIDMGTRAEADFVSVEKWFGRYCTLAVEPVALEGLKLDQFNPLFTVSFVQGPQQEILRSNEGVYLWGNRAFRSTELDEALKNLPELPQRAIQ